MSTPADIKRATLQRSTDTDDALISSMAALDHRKVLPKRIQHSDFIFGNNPATSYVTLSSNPVPDGSCFHIHTIEHLATVLDPNLANVTTIVAAMLVIVDLEPIMYSILRQNGNSTAGVIAFDWHENRIIPVDYYAAEGTIITIFQVSSYVGGGVATDMTQYVTVIGDLIELNEDVMGRGIGQVPAATAASWLATLAKFIL